MPYESSIMKKSFTIFEIVVVLVTLGILAAVGLPRLVTSLSSSKVHDLSLQLLDHIRYTQHLAMIDDKFDPNNPEWFKERWQIRFFTKKYASKDNTSKWAYAIFSDHNNGSGYDGNPNLNEIAKDPLNHKLISGGFTIYYSDKKTYKKAAIGQEYDVVKVRLSGGCSGKRISFDEVGRPYKGNIKDDTKPYLDKRLIKSVCRIKVCFEDASSCPKYFVIAIMPETGYSYIKEIVD